MQTIPLFSLSKIQPELIRLVRTLQDDLRQRCQQVDEVDAPLRSEYAQAQAAQRTQETYQAWRENYLNQVAVAWVLSSVFVRYLEDQDLIEERWLAGHGMRKGEPRERYTAFFRAHPEWSDREFFQDVFDRVALLPGCHDLFARDRNPLWKVGISGDGAKVLREFFAEVDPASGDLLRSFGGDTRFLGDLYQNLSEEAQKKYALLQTPDFVEEFILDRTLVPAIREFGLEQVKLIDPTCGSGHFLLGAFHRLFRLWQQKAPGENVRVLARRALEAVHGVDINPFAVAIARFRLLIAFAQVCGLSRLRDLPELKVHVATGDSLLHGNTLCSAKGWGVQELSDWLPDAFAAGDFEDAAAILSQRYEAVVGNPPYIVDRDKAHNAAIRARYKTAYRQYSLAVPFKEKFWDLAVEAKGAQRAGFVGMITANSFMKREFGSRLIEDFFPRVDLTHVLDTSGAYIPGHGTPTVILLGRNRSPILGTVRAVLGIRGEPSTPEVPARGLVWQSIVELVDRPGDSSAFVSATEVERSTFSKHPWSIGGGGASELKDKIESNSSNKLQNISDCIGFLAITGEDDLLVLDSYQQSCRVRLERSLPFCTGESLRDWSSSSGAEVICPYDTNLSLLDLAAIPNTARYLWVFREGLFQRKRFGVPVRQKGMRFYEWRELYLEKRKTPLSIAFAEVATHNHFVLDRGAKVFNQTAPIIKLPEGASEDDHLALVGLLNSSSVCFLLKQISTVKNMEGKTRKEPFGDGYQYSAAIVGSIPVPPESKRGLEFARRLDQVAQEIQGLDPGVVINASNLRTALDQSRNRHDRLRLLMVSLQEELDWLCYELYGILEKAPLAQDPPPIQLGERAFEIALARSGEETAWFTRHNSTPITELPAHWPDDYRAIVQQRLDLIETNPEIALLEKPEHKRRWQQRPWEERVKEAVTSWLQDRIEATLKNSENLTSASQLADELAGDDDFRQALQIYLGSDDYDLPKQVSQLVQSQCVPYLAALRYSEAGLRIRADWERTWELQRREDAGEAVSDIPVPPKYGQKDFLKSEYWSLRGKLDVPKERFISYPGAEREADGSLVLGWAGWNHLQRAQALASYALERREQDGWDKDRLTPMLAGLAELLPWLKQWHNEVDPDSGERMGDYFESFLSEQLRELELTPKDLTEWRPAQKVRSLRKPKKVST
ncbi:MAG: BREX-2 system adenine-specific DNA-methyltransferase PglX [Vulcanimicrobiota bacterium]